MSKAKRKEFIENKYCKVWLSIIKIIGIKQYEKLIKRFESIEGIYNAPKEKIEKVEGITKKAIEMLTNNAIKKDVKRHINYMEKNNIDIISIEDKEYPQILKKIYNPPLNLYIRGNKNILEKNNFSIVGCREATEYGKYVAKSFAYKLAKKDFNIVSGLARGIDTYAHIGAMNASNITIAVLANGLDSVFPPENIKLAEKIVELGGCIISEYPLGTKPYRENFPLRNRIISGLSKGVLVIEAKPKSGTMITVDMALEQGREVFAVPGNIDSINSYGTNELIKQGAIITTSIDDIINNI